jgi:hypothetical protein
VLSSTGRGLLEIESEWDLPRVEAWLHYCEKHPPLQAMVAAYLGLEKSEGVRVTEENFTEFIGMLQMDSKTSGSA